jgi:hypothetical protein
MNSKVINIFIILFLASNAQANEIETITKNLSNAIVCKSNPANAVYELVQKGSNFKLGYSAYGFGEGTGYKAVAILNEPLALYGSTTFAVISETESSYFNFAAFTYGKFEGDYTQIVKALNLKPASPFTEESLGQFVSNQPESNSCPKTIVLTPMENGYFLLGCGWCNGG